MTGGAEAVLGVEGCPGGWIGALVRDSAVTWLVLPDAEAILSVDAAVIAIDIPIGLPEAGDGYRRGADLEAREFLGPWSAANAVFFTPVRPVVAARTYLEANSLSRELTGKGLSKQTWNICDRIALVDDALGDSPDARSSRPIPKSPSASSTRRSIRRSGPPAVVVSGFPRCPLAST